MHTCMVHTHTLICTVSLCIYVHVHTRTHTHVHACVHSHTQHYSGEVMLQAFTAKAEPMRGWDARSQIRRRGAYLEIYHPVRHEGHHHRQELHQHLEVGHVFLWRRTPWVRPLIRQQKGTFRVSVRPQGEKQKNSHNSTLSSTKATGFYLSHSPPRIPIEGPVR